LVKAEWFGQAAPATGPTVPKAHHREPYAYDITAGKGNDCILGGGGDDTLKADPGSDACIGGPVTDSFHNSCELQIR
jgi:Ca2+-binding RTX toxin-like protein